jgi:hypothetical protein
MGNNKEILLVYREMTALSLTHPVNIMLTPQFYTMKKEVLAIRYHYQAKKIAPSIFEGLLDQEQPYEYFVFKEREAWVFIAYNPEEIKYFLETKGISPSLVSKLFFAQQAQKKFIEPVAVNQTKVLTTIDGVVVLLPRTLLSNSQDITTFDTRFIPSSGISLGNNHLLIGKKEALIFTTLFSIFAGLFFIEGWWYSQNLTVQQREKQALLAHYPALQSSLQRESILDKYRTIDHRERQKRETIKKLASMIFKGVTLREYHMDEKHFKLMLDCNSTEIAEKVYTMATQSHFKVIRSQKSPAIVIEGNL